MKQSRKKTRKKSDDQTENCELRNHLKLTSAFYLSFSFFLFRFLPKWPVSTVFNSCRINYFTKKWFVRLYMYMINTMYVVTDNNTRSHQFMEYFELMSFNWMHLNVRLSSTDVVKWTNKTMNKLFIVNSVNLIFIFSMCIVQLICHHSSTFISNNNKKTNYQLSKWNFDWFERIRKGDKLALINNSKEWLSYSTAMYSKTELIKIQVIFYYVKIIKNECLTFRAGITLCFIYRNCHFTNTHSPIHFECNLCSLNILNALTLQHYSQKVICLNQKIHEQCH